MQRHEARYAVADLYGAAMRGDPDDILRSLRRYVSLMLGSPPWTVRLQRTRVEDDARPAAVVEKATPLTTPHSRSSTLSQGDVQKAQGYAIMCYPTVEATAASSAQEARRVAGLLDAGFSRGLVTSDDPPLNIGAPWYFPVYDYAGVPIEGAASSRKGPTQPYMHAEIDSTFNVRELQDPLDELRFTVLANLRVLWWAPGRVPPTAPVVRRLPEGWEPSPSLPEVPLLPDVPC